MVKAQSLLIDDFGIDRLHAVIGGSMGGMQTLQWAIDFPERLDAISRWPQVRHTAQAIAFNDTGRQAIISDPAWKQGDYDPSAARSRSRVARMMAHITYLSDVGMESKFGRKRRSGDESKEHFDVEFEVESYLRYQGASFVSRFDANTYLYLTKALDRFDLHSPESLDATLSAVKSQV